MKKKLMSLIVGLGVLCISGLAFADFVGNKDSKIFHSDQCPMVKQMKKENMVNFKTAEEAVKAGYTLCKKCAGATTKEAAFIGNKDSKMYHMAGCPMAAKIKAENGIDFDTKEAAEKAGFKACSKCAGGKAEEVKKEGKKAEKKMDKKKKDADTTTTK